MLAPWIGQEMRTTALGDRRLNERLQEILDQLSKHPTASIPSACGGYAETTAAYRFFDNDRVTFAEVLRPHIDATWERIEQQTFVLLVQDTTECDVTRPEHQVRGAGPLDRGTRRGGCFICFMHSRPTARRSAPRTRFLGAGLKTRARVPRCPVGNAWRRLWKRKKAIAG